MKNAVPILLLMLLISGCKPGKLDSLGWILGNWYLDTPEGRITEAWQKSSDTLYTGYSLMISPKGDTLFSEKIKLVLHGDVLWYIPTVSNQNGGMEVPFKEKSSSATEIVFENAQHDFPQRIIYRKLSADAVQARIEGTVNGIAKSEDFPYKREK